MRLAILILVLALFAGCTDPEPQSIASGWIKWGNAPDPTAPDWTDEVVLNYDWVAFSSGAWNSDRMKAAAVELRERNPDIKLGEYFHVMAVGAWVFRARDEGRLKPGSWAQIYYDTMVPYLARTNKLDPATGEPDTASIFLRSYCVNLLAPGAIDALADFYVTQDAEGLDWFFMDFMTVPMPNLKKFQDPIYTELQSGEMDLDQDGVGHWDDLDEQAALRVAFEDLIAALRARLPADFLLIPNGRLAMVDDDFSRLVDGVFVEGFPQWFFGTGWNYEGALLEPDRVPSVWSLTKPRYRRGYGTVMLHDMYNSRMLGHVAGCFPGAVEVMDGDAMALPRTPYLRRQLGHPIDEPVLNGREISRQFEQGTLYIVVDEEGRLHTRHE
jgi:hypothetical protein